MPASFAVGATKVFAGTEPRFVVVTGHEAALRGRIVASLRSRTDVDFVSVTTDEDLRVQVATQSLWDSKTKIVYIPRTDFVADWDWLPVWLNKMKRMQLVVETDEGTANFLEKKVNTRGLVISCVAPTGPTGQAKLIKMLADWYGQSITQLTLLLNKYDWQITPCVQLLDKLALLNLKLTSDTISLLGIVRSAQTEFIKYLTENKQSIAMTMIAYIGTDSYATILDELSTWLNELSSVKSSVGFMKSVSDVAFETKLPAKRVEELMPQARRYDWGKLAHLTLLLAVASKNLARGYTNGLLEIMVNDW